MIIESLIKDDVTVSFDCCKTAIKKGGTITVSDEFYYDREIQGAQKQGLIRITSKAPAKFLADEKTVEKRIRLQNLTKSIVSLDCIKTSILPEESIEASETVLKDKEVSTAISSKLIKNMGYINAKKIESKAPIAIAEKEVEQSEFDWPAEPQKTKKISKPKNKIVKPKKAQAKQNKTTKEILIPEHLSVLDDAIEMDMDGCESEGKIKKLKG